MLHRSARHSIAGNREDDGELSRPEGQFTPVASLPSRLVEGGEPKRRAYLSPAIQAYTVNAYHLHAMCMQGVSGIPTREHLVPNGMKPQTKALQPLQSRFPTEEAHERK